MKIHKDYPLKYLNSFKVPASAKLFSEIYSIDNLKQLLENSLIKNERKLILGGGSNILFVNDFDGIVIANKIGGINIISETEDEVLISAGGGVVWDELVDFTVNRNLSGLENLSLIPGTVGAAPIQNIGAYGVELRESFVSLKALELSTRKVWEFTNEDCKFGYRNSIFKNEYKGKFFIFEVTFQLKKNPALNITYASLKDEFEKLKNSEPTVKLVSGLVKKIRRSKLPDPDELGNAGSFFKNPEVPKLKLEELKKNFEKIPFYKVDNEIYKVPAGWLIEKCGMRGFKLGKVGTYSQQALVLVNYGVKSGEEIKKFSEEIRKRVSDKFGIMLQTEVNII